MDDKCQEKNKKVTDDKMPRFSLISSRSESFYVVSHRTEAIKQTTFFVATQSLYYCFSPIRM